MSETCVIEVYENQIFSRKKGWSPNVECPYTMKASMQPCKAIEEITVPSAEWSWACNWKISKMPGATDAEGWEYASRFSRFKVKDRAPKVDPKWSKARRRLWTRVMRREVTVKAADLGKAIQKIQTGLGSVHAARIKIEDIMKTAPESAESDQMKALVTSVYRNIADMLAVLDQAEAQPMATNVNANGNANNRNGSGKSNIPNPAALKKLRNDVLKEQAAIERALDPSLPPSGNANAPNGSAAAATRARGMSNQSTGNGSFSAGSFTQRPSVYAGSGGILRSSFSSGAHATPSGVPTNTVWNATAANSTRPSFDNHNFRRSNASMAGEENLFDQRSSSRELRNDLKSIESILPAHASKPVVKSGNAHAFAPTVSFSEKGRRKTGMEVEDGEYMDRTTQELLISQQLIAVDEVTVMQDIIEDRHKEIEKIHGGLVEINSMFTDLSRMVHEQESEITQIYGNIEESHARTQEAFKHILEANRLQQTGNCVIS